jgi:hypothetical protein
LPLPNLRLAKFSRTGARGRRIAQLLRPYDVNAAMSWPDLRPRYAPRYFSAATWFSDTTPLGFVFNVMDVSENATEKPNPLRCNMQTKNAGMAGTLRGIRLI